MHQPLRLYSLVPRRLRRRDGGPDTDMTTITVRSSKVTSKEESAADGTSQFDRCVRSRLVVVSTLTRCLCHAAAIHTQKNIAISDRVRLTDGLQIQFAIFCGEYQRFDTREIESYCLDSPATWAARYLFGDALGYR